MSTLILLRHGQSEWNAENLFTGWYDCGLTELGEQEAAEGGRLMKADELAPAVVHTSVQQRAIRTAEITLAEMGRSWIPVRRHWRLNERHYGDLQGRNKKETAEKYGAEQLHQWRRGYDTPPPPLDFDDQRHARFDVRYRDIPSDQLPASECLADVVQRMLPYWHDVIVPDLAAGTVLVAAHGNSLRALVKHLKRIPDDEITELEIPTGVPWVFELDSTDRCRVIRDRWLGDPAAVAARAEAVKNQSRI